MFAYEAAFTEFLRLVPEGAVLDIGANIGMTTVPLAKKFPAAHVYSFEPIPANYATLKRIIKHYRLTNVTLFEAALGEEPGVLKLVVPVINKVHMYGLSHDYKEGRNDEWNTGNVYSIPMLKLDDIAALQEVKKIAAIKIDVENFEYYILKGGRQLLLKHKPVIYCELWPNEMRQPVLDLVKEIGYSVKVLQDGTLADFDNQPVTNFILLHGQQA
jgi:FkbM family methyltransferase